MSTNAMPLLQPMSAYSWPSWGSVQPKMLLPEPHPIVSRLISACRSTFLHGKLPAKPFTQAAAAEGVAGSAAPVIAAAERARSTRGTRTRRMRMDRSSLFQLERLRQKHRHLSPGIRVVRAVVATAAASGDALCRELLDPVGKERRTRHVSEGAGARGRHIQASMLGLQE